jgi:hypothetical protein
MNLSVFENGEDVASINTPKIFSFDLNFLTALLCKQNFVPIFTLAFKYSAAPTLATFPALGFSFGVYGTVRPGAACSSFSSQDFAKTLSTDGAVQIVTLCYGTIIFWFTPGLIS